MAELFGSRTWALGRQNKAANLKTLATRPHPVHPGYSGITVKWGNIIYDLKTFIIDFDDSSKWLEGWIGLSMFLVEK